MKRVGIITMHRPISFGSSLQAYALQKAIQDIGYDCEIIDYQYPNSQHKTRRFSIKNIVSKVIHYFMNALFGMPCLVEFIRFKKFRKKFLCLSRYYKDAEQLRLNPPLYDIYCTGSDQVWNSNFTKGDTSFLLSFVREGKKVSYASSFAIDYIVEDYIKTYAHCLAQYSAISVREHNGISLVKDLTGMDAALVCDPTLLLPREEWLPLIKESRIRIDKPYVLVFMLTYSYNPYPDVNDIINFIQLSMGLHVVVLSGNKYDYCRKDTTVIKNAGPLEFLYLIENASYVITSSFHGVAFCVNFSKPFIAIIKKDNKDTRILSFLKRIGLEKHAVAYNDKINAIDLSIPDISGCVQFREDSLKYLQKFLRH